MSLTVWLSPLFIGYKLALNLHKSRYAKLKLKGRCFRKTFDDELLIFSPLFSKSYPRNTRTLLLVKRRANTQSFGYFYHLPVGRLPVRKMTGKCLTVKRHAINPVIVICIFHYSSGKSINFSIIACNATTVPMMQPKNPKMKRREFLMALHLNLPKSCQLEAVSIKAGAIMLRVDILTAPRRETKRSNQGTVAANPTEKEKKKLDLLYNDFVSTKNGL